MRFRWWNFVLCIFAKTSLIYASVTSNFDYAIQEIIQRAQIHHLTIFTDNNASSLNGTLQNSLLDSAIGRIPILMIDLIRIHKRGYNRSLEIPVFNNPRASTVYVILQDQELNLEKVYNIIDNFVTISPIPTRPKCLLILYNNQDWLEVELKQILRYAWSFKFLDFSIMIIHSVNHIIILNYNPFMEIYNMNIYNANDSGSVIDIFPDKMTNMNNYSLQLPVYNAAPYLLVQKTSNGEMIINGSKYAYLETFSKKLNFYLHFTTQEGNGTMEHTQTAIKKLENNTLTMLPVEGPVMLMLHGYDIVIGNYLGINKYVFIVPTVTKLKLNFSPPMLLYISFFPLILLIFCIVTHLFKRLGSKSLENFHILEVLIGVSTSQPLNARDRILFFTIAILSIIYSSDFFSILTDIKFVKYDLRFDKLEDFLNSKLTLYSHISANEYDTEDIKKLLSSSINTMHLFDCVNTLMSNNDAICVTANLLALDVVNSYINEYGQPLMKLAELSFGYDFNAYAYERASPYVEKFNWICQQILESGLPIRWDSQIIPNVIPEANEDSSTNSSLGLLLPTMLLIGFCTGLLVFFYELLAMNHPRHRAPGKLKIILAIRLK